MSAPSCPPSLSRQGTRKPWKDSCWASLDLALEESQAIRFHTGAEAVEVKQKRSMVMPIVRDFVHRERPEDLSSTTVGLKSQLGAALTRSAATGLLSRAIAAIAALQEAASPNSSVQARFAASLDCAISTGELALGIAAVVDEQDIGLDPPVPSDPAAASIFEVSSKVLPPAPAWLSSSLLDDATRRGRERRSQDIFSPL